MRHFVSHGLDVRMYLQLLEHGDVVEVVEELVESFSRDSSGSSNVGYFLVICRVAGARDELS